MFLQVNKSEEVVQILSLKTCLVGCGVAGLRSQQLLLLVLVVGQAVGFRNRRPGQDEHEAVDDREDGEADCDPKVFVNNSCELG